MSGSGWHWGTWQEPLVLGGPEWAAIALAHAIILGIAWARYRRRR